MTTTDLDAVRAMVIRWRRYGCEAEAVLTEQAIREIMNLREELEARSRMLRQDGDN
jgi:hypothetical protein